MESVAKMTHFIYLLALYLTTMSITRVALNNRMVVEVKVKLLLRTKGRLVGKGGYSFITSEMNVDQI